MAESTKIYINILLVTVSFDEFSPCTWVGVETGSSDFDAMLLFPPSDLHELVY